MRLMLYSDCGGELMGQKEKLIAKLKTIPKDFTFDEAESLLGYLTYHRYNKGKTSGSRVIFISDEYNELMVRMIVYNPNKRIKLRDVFKSKLITKFENKIYLERRKSFALTSSPLTSQLRIVRVAKECLKS